MVRQSPQVNEAMNVNVHTPAPLTQRTSSTMTTSNFEKFNLLLWKNYILGLRHWVQTIFEVLIPVICCALLILIRALVTPDEYDDPTIFQELDLNSVQQVRVERQAQFENLDFRLAYSPNNELLRQMVQEASDTLGLDRPILGVANAQELERELLNLDIPIFAGIQFDDSLNNMQTLPDRINMAIRFSSEMRTYTDADGVFWANWQTDFIFPEFQVNALRNNEDQDGGNPANYFGEGFASVQNAIGSAFINRKLPVGETMPRMFLQRVPYPPYVDDILLQGFEAILPLIILISFFYICINTVRFITTEKEKQLKEAMKIMGLPNWIHWLAWFTKSMIILIVSISLITVLLCVPLTTNTDLAIFPESAWTVIWMFLFIFSITTIMYCFMLSVFFSKANTAAAVAGLMWFIFNLPFNIVQMNYDELSLGAKIGISFFSNSAMSLGFMLTMRHEGTGYGLQWNNLFDSVSVDDDFSVGAVWLMLLVDAAIYLSITLYFEQVFPGEYGVPEPWNFLFTKKFWTSKVDATNYDHIQSTNDPSVMEAEPTHRHAGVKIKGLKKIYSNKKTAVAGLHLNMYEDQITVLLGHNGAGKTTTMSMLTGMFPPTSGTASINGEDIRTNIQGVRSSLGLCPQHNVLFDELTVREHIIFFGRLKGLKSKEVENEVKRYVELLELKPKMNAQSSTLSGGMKRKLGVGVALVGGSKVVLLDEPTSGMDPAARRALWDLLALEKKGRTLLLSTHFMDEADVLGDRIAIMADGVLKACGSSFFLKKKFGVGYRLICVKEARCRTNDVTALLRQHIPNLEIETNIGSELSYVLNESYASIYQPLLKNLEENSDRLGLSSYGISLTTLEEVFLKVGSDSHNLEQNEDKLKDKMRGKDAMEAFNSTEYLSPDAKLLTGFPLRKNQIQAMFIKKFISTKRSWVTFLMMLLIPVIFVCMTIAIVRSQPDPASMPPLFIELDSYRNPVTVLEGTTADNNFYGRVSRAYQQLYDDNREELTLTDNMTAHILQRSEENLNAVNNRYMIAATIAQNRMIAWFNNRAYHTAPLSINMIHNAVLRAHCNSGSDCGIDVINRPLPFTAQTRLRMLQGGNNMGFQLGFNTAFAMAFVGALYIIFYIRERVSRAKLLQYVSGANILTFWAVSFIWDYITFITISLLYILTLAIFQEDNWSSFEELGRVFLVLLMFGYGLIPFTYLASMIFDVPSSGFVKINILYIFTGIIMFMTVFIMEFDGFDLEDVANGLTWAFLIFPHFCFSQALNRINIISSTLAICNDINIPIDVSLCADLDIFAWSDGIGRNLVFLFLIGTICFCGVLFMEYRVIDRVFRKGGQYTGPPPRETEDSSVDSDVRTEKDRINGMTMPDIRNQNLVIKNVTKFYNKFLAVNQLSIAVTSSECFGLLGVNGAGKTTTFKMMTGDETISSGDAWVKGTSLKADMNEVHKTIGYCPQFDALLDDLTGRETLKIFCLLRGVQPSRIAKLSSRLADDLNFTKHIDKKVKEYSGGNKRKLSTAIALVGDPSVVYLDEPTTGMDPGAKRQLWNMICKIRDEGLSIVLTSHSMEECEALCTRLAIMVNGEFKCLGSTQHLKNKFSKGYVLNIKMKRTETASGDFDKTKADGIKSFVATNLVGAFLKEEYQDTLTYQIQNPNLKWSEMFGIMELCKTKLNIEDYSLGQSSLEQVFLYFTKYQRE